MAGMANAGYIPSHHSTRLSHRFALGSLISHMAVNENRTVYI